MKNFILTILFVVAGVLPNGDVLFGFSVPQVIGIGSLWRSGALVECVVWEGASRICSEDERALMVSLWSLH